MKFFPTPEVLELGVRTVSIHFRPHRSFFCLKIMKLANKSLGFFPCEESPQYFRMAVLKNRRSASRHFERIDISVSHETTENTSMIESTGFENILDRTRKSLAAPKYRTHLLMIEITDGRVGYLKIDEHVHSATLSVSDVKETFIVVFHAVTPNGFLEKAFFVKTDSMNIKLNAHAV